MFRKAKNDAAAEKPSKKNSAIPSVVTSDVHLLGNLVSESIVDFAGTIDGNIQCDVLTLRAEGTVKGEITANVVNIHGTVKGLIKARAVNLLASCKVEGIIIHEQLSIEDGAFVDGKFKRSDRAAETAKLALEDRRDQDEDGDEDAGKPLTNTKILENIRLIR